MNILGEEETALGSNTKSSFGSATVIFDWALGLREEIESDLFTGLSFADKAQLTFGTEDDIELLLLRKDLWLWESEDTALF